MATPFNAICDDFYINMRLGSHIALPHQRETVLHFFEQVQKAFPSMSRFRRSEGGDFSLEEDRNQESYRWMSLETKRLVGGAVNPSSFEDGMKLHRHLLDIAPHGLGVSPVEIDFLDVLFGFDLTFSGNHDEIIAESLYRESPLNCLSEESHARPVDFQPTMTTALTEDCRLQARIDVVTRTSSFQNRTNDYSDDVISVYLVLRQYWGDRPKASLEAMLFELAERNETLCTKYLVPQVIKPISAAIASRS